MLQQTELIFDFASDHHSMSQVSKHEAVVLSSDCEWCDRLTTPLSEFVCPADGKLLGLLGVGHGAGSPFTTALLYRSSV